MMPNVESAIRNTIPITMFNRGLAGKVFEEVRQSGAKVVMKNNVAECVLLSPEEYLRMIDELNEARLHAIATERLSRLNPDELVSSEALYAEMGITSEAMEAFGEVEIE